MNAVSCFLLKFVLLLKPSKDKLYDLIARDHGRKRLKDVFCYIATEKKKKMSTRSQVPVNMQNLWYLSKVLTLQTL